MPYHGPERRQSQQQGQTVNVYATLSPEHREQLARIEFILRGVFHQNDAMLDLIVELGKAPPGDPAGIGALAARVQSVRDALADALTQNAPPTT